MTVPIGWIVFLRLHGQQPLMEHHQYIAEVCAAAPIEETGNEAVCGRVPTLDDPSCRLKHGGRAPVTSNRSSYAYTYTIEPTRDRYDEWTLNAPDEGD